MKASTAVAVERPAIVWERARAEPLEYGIWPERPVTIGREATNTIVIDSPFVSKAHALLQFQDGQYVLEDLGSANGTRVNGEPITSVPLHPGDVVEFGDERLSFVDRASRAAERSGGLSKWTKLLLAALATAVVTTSLLGLLVWSLQPNSNQTSQAAKASTPDAPPADPGKLPAQTASSGVVAEVVARAELAGVSATDALYDEAMVQFRVGRLRESRELLLAVLARDPSHELAVSRLRAVEGGLLQAIARYGAEGDRAYAQLRYDAAIAAWEQVLLLSEPSDPYYRAAREGLERARARISR